MPRAGLNTDRVVAEAADLADEVGLDQLTLAALAARLGVRQPSLYKHVASQADLAHRVAVLAMTELADAIRDAIQGRAGREALVAGAQAMRSWVLLHPGRYAAGNAALITGPDDPLLQASGRVIDSWAAMLHGYRLDAAEELHALRMLRSTLHGFAVLEVEGGFRFDTDVDVSFAWLVRRLDEGLRAAGSHVS